MEGQRPMNPYRPCCLNCVNFNEPYCDRIQGVRVFKDRPRKMTRCGYFERLKKINR